MDIASAIGRSRDDRDVADPARFAALHATLGFDGPGPRAGDPLPPLGHFLMFWPATARDGLGEDGHERLGDFLPDFGRTRRMWAGSRIAFVGHARIGETAARKTTVAAIEAKRTRAGPAHFVTLRHEISFAGRPAIVDEQDLVHLALPAGPPEPVVRKGEAAPEAAEAQWTLETDAPLLFRYSALTFNTHRIHYDADHCRLAEGYLGPVVHGPLIATLLSWLALALGGGGRPPRRFSYRAMAPSFCGETLAFCADRRDGGADAFLRLPDGGLGARGRMEF
ncbi:MAG: hypothetical protein KGI57_07790 [Hyphomicrobiales bacterium]|nr:hypothetical protein [Hyphomicrobiales bacterium]MDE2017590.1 hypothetical protein [Hyphomicrobiales bacterium]